jgi:hypothetical protein
VSNIAFLINTDAAPGAGRSARVSADHAKAVRYEGPGYTYPLAWICCFRRGDLRQPPKAGVPVAVTTTAKALENLKASWPRYVALTGSAPAAREFWQLAMDRVRELPFRHLCLDPTELIALSDDLAAGVAAFSEALSVDRDPASTPNDIFEYHSGVLPFKLADVYGKVLKGRGKAFEDRRHNFKVLDWPGQR